MGRGSKGTIAEDNTAAAPRSRSALRNSTRLSAAAQAFVDQHKNLLTMVGRVSQETLDSEESQTRAAAAWREIYHRAEYSKMAPNPKTGRSERRSTPAWFGLQARMCAAVKAGDAALQAEGIDRNADKGHPLVPMIESLEKAFFGANYYFIKRDVINKYGHPQLWEGEDKDGARRIVSQEALAGLAHGMRRFDPDLDNTANPLTYTLWWAKAFVRRNMKETGRSVNLKTAEGNRLKVRAAVRDIEGTGRNLSVAEIADKTGLSAEDVLFVLPHIDGVSHLDAPIAGADDEHMTVGTAIADDSVDISASLLDDDMRDTLNAAAADLPNPYQRAVMEMMYGLNGRPRARQNQLFDGVFVDKQGRQFASKSAIRTAPHRLGPNGEVVVEHEDAKVLNEKLRSGEVVFQPGTPEAAELVRIQALMRGETADPWAPSSGSVQDAQKRAEDAIRNSARMRGMRNGMRYRGPDMVENSEMALDELRLALIEIGAATPAEAAKLKTGALSSDGSSPTRKGSARLNGERAGLINESDGRYTQKMVDLLGTIEKRRNATVAEVEEEEDFAAMMSEV